MPQVSPEPESLILLDANEALLANIREMMDEMRSDIINKFDSAISESKVNGM